MVFNGAQFHMLMNHLPVVGFAGMVLALFITLFVKSWDIRRFVLLATVLVGLSAIPANLTGEPAEEVIEHMPGVSEKLIEEHEEIAEKATILSVITAVVAGLAYFVQRRRPETLNKSIPVVFVFSLATAGVMGWAAHEGGLIRHPEINPNAPTAAESEPTANQSEEHGGKEHEGG